MSLSKTRIEEFVEDIGLDGITKLFEDPDYGIAFVGVDLTTGRAIYDIDAMIRYLVVEDEEEYDYVADFILHSVLSHVSQTDDAPIIMRRMWDF